MNQLKYQVELVGKSMKIINVEVTKEPVYLQHMAIVHIEHKMISDNIVEVEVTSERDIEDRDEFITNTLLRMGIMAQYMTGLSKDIMKTFTPLADFLFADNKLKDYDYAPIRNAFDKLVSQA